jgi:hypothetical protein
MAGQQNDAVDVVVAVENRFIFRKFLPILYFRCAVYALKDCFAYRKCRQSRQCRRCQNRYQLSVNSLQLNTKVKLAAISAMAKVDSVPILPISL